MEDAIASAAEELWREGPGDILVFLPGEREIRETGELLRRSLARRPYAGDVELLPLYARLSVQDQQRVFAPSRGRRIVLATNVAETSLTVPGIRYVIDTGLARVKRYSVRNKTTQLAIEKIAQSAAQPARGTLRARAGRHLRAAVRRGGLRGAAGVHRSRDPAQLARLGDPAHERARAGRGRGLPVPRPAHAARHRRRLPAAAGARGGRRGAHADAGRARARAPAARPAHRPHRARRARRRVPARGAGHRERAGRARSARASAGQAAGGRPGAPALPRRAFRLPVARGAVGVLRGGARRRSCRTASWSTPAARSSSTSCGCASGATCTSSSPTSSRRRGGSGRRRCPRPSTPRATRCCTRRCCPACSRNVGQKSADGDGFEGTRGLRFHLHPGSGLAKKAPRWVLAAELVETSRLFARVAARVEPEWIEEVAGERVTRDYFEPHWDEQRGEVVASERVQLYGLTLVPRRPALVRRDRSGARPRGVHPRGAGAGHARDEGRIPRRQREAGEGDRGAGAQGAPPGRARRPGGDGGVLRRAPARRTSPRSRPSSAGARRPSAGIRASCTSRARG